VGINDKCPCGSGLKYKHCCKTYHDGRVPKNALLLMKSRYSAYALGKSKYIIKTNYDNKDTIKSIDEFSRSTLFKKLEILEFIDGEDEAFVTFKVTLLTNGQDNSFEEKSKFLKQNDTWFYIDGEIH